MLQIQNSKQDKYAAAFKRLSAKRRIGFCPFAMLGDPDEKGTLARIRTYLKSGADFLELGIPFSDPMADGPVIQASSERALKNGMTPEKAIALVEKIRRLTEYSAPRGAKFAVPIGILTYANIVFQYGIPRFYRDLAQAGANSVLIADLPLEEAAPFTKAARKNNLHQIFLVSEYTDSARLKSIEKFGSGFLYVVSNLGVTGQRRNLGKKIKPLLKSLKKQTRLPLMVGFGVSKPTHLRQLEKAEADGAIVGSALYALPTRLFLFLNSFV